MHASAGPLEGLKERVVWVARDPLFGEGSLRADPFGAALLKTGVPLGTLQAWLSTNPAVTTPGGEVGKVFDLTEGMDSADMLALASKLV